MNLSVEATESKQSLPVDLKTNEHSIDFDIAVNEEYIEVNFSSSNDNLTAEFEASGQNINAGFGEIQFIEVEKDVEIYKGSCTVTPKAYEQQLKTANCKMTDNVTVKEIPYFEVSNSAGGNTLNIG